MYARTQPLYGYGHKDDSLDNNRHHKPHVHVFYGDFKASIAIDGELLAGKLPDKQLKILTVWLYIHEDELYAAWNNAVRGMQFDKIEPLR